VVVLSYWNFLVVVGLLHAVGGGEGGGGGGLRAPRRARLVRSSNAQVRRPGFGDNLADAWGSYLFLNFSGSSGLRRKLSGDSVFSWVLLSLDECAWGVEQQNGIVR
jgi:hypothetical protein